MYERMDHQSEIALVMLNQIISDTCDYVAKQPVPASYYLSETPKMAIVHDHVLNCIGKQIYRPIFCLVLQGAKELALGERRIEVRTGQSLIVSYDLPVTTQILEATPEKPYIALVIEIDLGLVRSLYDQVSDALADKAPARSIDVGEADQGLIDAMRRLLALHTDPLDAAVLEPLIRREIHYRLLMANHGAMLRELLRIDSHAERIAKAIRRIQDDFRKPLSVPDLAGLSAMSLSTFHEHFKAVTGNTPLQYQKAIRLIEARRLITETDRSVSAVAFDVGYESPTQFSREYARKFGAPPSTERKQIIAA